MAVARSSPAQGDGAHNASHKLTLSVDTEIRKILMTGATVKIRKL